MPGDNSSGVAETEMVDGVVVNNVCVDKMYAVNITEPIDIPPSIRRTGPFLTTIGTTEFPNESFFLS